MPDELVSRIWDASRKIGAIVRGDGAVVLDKVMKLAAVHHAIDDVALLLNWILAGRHILFFDPKNATLSRAAAAALDHWAVRAMAPNWNAGRSVSTSIEDAKPKAPAERRTRAKVGATRPR